SGSVINVGNSNVATSLSNVYCANVSGGIITGNGSCPTSTSKWILDSANGVLYPTNITVDLLVGGSATNSSTTIFAKFAVLNVAGGTPTASVAAGVAGAAYLTAAGNLQTTANQTLTLGGATTGGITFTPNGSTLLSLSGKGSDVAASISANTSAAAFVVDNIGGSISPTGALFTASSSGLSRFTIQQNGTIVIGADQNTPTKTFIRGGAALGNGVAGSDFYIDASNGTGTQSAGNLIFRTGQALTTTINNADNVITHDTDTSVGATATSSNTTIAFTVCACANSYLILQVIDNANDGSITATYNGNSMTKIGSTFSSIANIYMFGIAIANPDGASHNIVISYGRSDGTIVAGASSFNGVLQSNPVGIYTQSSCIAANCSPSTLHPKITEQISGQRMLVDFASSITGNVKWTATASG